MKKLLKIIGFVVGLIVLYCVGAMVFYDTKRHNEQTMVINAPKEKVWSYVSTMKSFNGWNPWMKYDPNLKVTFHGTSGEVGDGYHWIGNDDVGEGEQEITAIVPMQKVATKMHFIKPMNDTATSDLILADDAKGTKVTWTIDYEVETLYKPMIPMMNHQMDKSYKEGLTNLKNLSEK